MNIERELLNAIRRAQAKLRVIEDASATRLMRILIDAERELVVAVQNGLRGEWNMNAVRALMNEITRISENGLFAQADWLSNTIPEVGKRALAVDYAMLGVAGYSAEDIVATYKAYTSSEAYTALLNEGYQHWWNEILMRNEAYLQTVQAELTRGATLHLDVDTIAKNLIEAKDRLNLEITNPEVWAERLTRTELTRISNDIHVTFGQEAGCDLFYNIGVPDDRQSEICAEASMQDPMSMEQWVASKWGVPPRHPNCRCALAMWSNDWGIDFDDVTQLQRERMETMAA